MIVYKCPICGNIIFVMDGNAKSIRCCGSELIELTANDTDAALEKHVPSYEIVNDKIDVTIGEVEHPMDKDHYIMWIAIVYDNKYEIKSLNPFDKPKAVFDYYDNSVIYAYCNKHGLWKKEID